MTQSQMSPMEIVPVCNDSMFFVDPLAEPRIRDVGRVPLMAVDVKHTPLVRQSPVHGRSFEDPAGLYISQEPLADENGDVYSAFSIKGCDVSNPLASYNAVEPRGVRVRGMLDGLTFARCVGTSRVLRRAGILTEWPLYHGRPKQFPVDDDESVGLNNFRRMLYDNYVYYNDVFKETGVRKPDSVSRAGVVGQGIAEMQFSVMYRAMMTNTRLGEIPLLIEKSILPAELEKAIKALQARKPEHFSVWPELEKLDASDPDDQKKYMETILPAIMGENLGRLHAAGSYHKYAHQSNWTLAGEIVDLDSMRNLEFEPEDASDITAKNRLNEVFQVANTVALIGKITGKKQEMFETFMGAYIAEGYLSDFVTKLEEVVYDSFQEFDTLNESGLGLPRILDMNSATMRGLRVQILERAVRGEEFDKDNSVWRLVQESLAQELGQGMLKMLDEEGINDSPGWFIPERIGNLEFIRVYDYLRDYYQSFCETARQGGNWEPVTALIP